MFVQIDSDSYAAFKEQTPPIETIKPGVYDIRYSDSVGTYIHFIAEEMRLPKKIYESTPHLVRRIFSNFDENRLIGRNTGFMLTGKAGSGKTVDSSLIANELIKQGGLVINVDNSSVGEVIAAVKFGYTQPTMFIFDEFEKNFDKEQQEELLTIFDGGVVKGMLFGIIANDASKIIPPYHSRPGRALYSITYDGLSADTIKQFLLDNLGEDNRHFKDALTLATDSDAITYDVLTSLSNECRLFQDLDFDDIIDILNIGSEGATDYLYKGELKINGNLITKINSPSSALPRRVMRILTKYAEKTFSGLSKKEQDVFYRYDAESFFSFPCLNYEQYRPYVKYFPFWMILENDNDYIVSGTTDKVYEYTENNEEVLANIVFKSFLSGSCFDSELNQPVSFEGLMIKIRTDLVSMKVSINENGRYTVSVLDKGVDVNGNELIYEMNLTEYPLISKPSEVL